MNLDDPKLTAYALNELMDPVETAEVEAWLKDHAEGRAFVSETQETAAFLSEKLHAGPAVTLTDEQRAAILEKHIVPFRNPRKEWRIIGLAALAACLALGPLLPWTELLRLRDSATPTVAINDKPMTLQMPVEENKNAVMKDQRQPAINAPVREQLGDAEPTFALGRLPGGADLKKEIAGADLPASAPQPMLDASKPVDGLALNEKLKGDVIMPASVVEPQPKEQTGAGSVSPKASAFASSVATVSGKPTLGFRGGGAAGYSKRGEETDDFLSFADKNSEKDSDKSTRRFRSNKRLDDLRRAGDRDDESNTESYDSLTENDFLSARENPLSTFSIDVDTASYANIRRFLNDGQLPPKGAVRIEEMLNYFSYDYPKPEGDVPFSTNLEVAECPWQPEHRLVRIGLRGKEIPVAERKAANLVFLIDVSGSMNEPNKLPLLKQSLRLLVDQLGENDKVALTVYAGRSGVVLPSTANKEEIRAALEKLQPGGSTNGASGIELAYQQAAANFIPDGVNRVILATDGDFNVGVTNQSDLVDLITAKAKTGVFLSVLGFGKGNVKDSTMEKLADKGNGNYAYIDGMREGKKVLVEQMGGTLVTIAKDVKIQVEFNPAMVSNYRLIGYENRALKKEDFSDDKKDAGEIGSGHTVTALYEVVMVGSMSTEVRAEPLRYSSNVTQKMSNLPSGEMLTVKLRYKEPSSDVSKKLEVPLTDDGKKMDAASKDFQFASAVAEVGQLLRQSEHRQLASWESALSRATEAKGEDRGGYRAEFVELIKRAQQLIGRSG